MSVKIIYKNCTSCKACHNHCPADVIGWDEQRNIPYIAYPDECNHCGVCFMECKFNAINLTLPPNCWSEVNKRYIPPVQNPAVYEWPEK